MSPLPNNSGSVNSWNPPIVETIAVKMMVGRSIGSVIDQNWRARDAPSIAAASYRSRGIDCIAAR